jgi:hypothetical protein
VAVLSPLLSAGSFFTSLRIVSLIETPDREFFTVSIAICWMDAQDCHRNAPHDLRFVVTKPSSG